MLFLTSVACPTGETAPSQYLHQLGFTQCLQSDQNVLFQQLQPNLTSEVMSSAMRDNKPSPTKEFITHGNLEQSCKTMSIFLPRRLSILFLSKLPVSWEHKWTLACCLHFCYSHSVHGAGGPATWFVLESTTFISC